MVRTKNAVAIRALWDGEGATVFVQDEYDWELRQRLGSDQIAEIEDRYDDVGPTLRRHLIIEDMRLAAAGVAS